MTEELYKLLDGTVTIGINPRVTLKLANVLDDVLAVLTTDSQSSDITVGELYDLVREYYDKPWEGHDGE